MTNAKPKPIVDGYHALTPHLIVDDAARAIEFYKKAFEVAERMRMADGYSRIPTPSSDRGADAGATLPGYLHKARIAPHGANTMLNGLSPG